MIKKATSRMTLEEKMAMLHAQSKFSSPGVPRLGIPKFWTTDGPHGVRLEVLWDQLDQTGWTNDSIIAILRLPLFLQLGTKICLGTMVKLWEKKHDIVKKIFFWVQVLIFTELPSTEEILNTWIRSVFNIKNGRSLYKRSAI